MGSYAQCWLGGIYVGSSKNDVDHGIMQLFHPSDNPQPVQLLQPAGDLVPTAPVQVHHTSFSPLLPARAFGLWDQRFSM